jgi:hypothetical protein
LLNKGKKKRKGRSLEKPRPLPRLLHHAALGFLFFSSR